MRTSRPVSLLPICAHPEIVRNLRGMALNRESLYKNSPAGFRVLGLFPRRIKCIKLWYLDTLIETQLISQKNLQ
jgi:hypothetical protein